MSAIPPQRLMSNRGGGCVEEVQIVSAPPNEHVLRVRAPVGVADQILLLDPSYAGTILQTGRLVLRGKGLSVGTPINELLGTLQGVLTVPAAGGVDYALALDWTKQPVDGQAPHSWPNTRIGDLVHRGKYWYKGSESSSQLRQVGRALTDELVTLINQHPLLRHANVVAAPPGHDAKVLSFGARLAASVASRREVHFEAVRSLSAFRTQAKELELADRAGVIHGQFACDGDLRGADVVIVDDLYSSGTTVGETARVLRLAGARRVAVLCAVRTLKSR
ncbi:hypothetical protein GCM10009745_65720 [Kribbella yunnanensis]|uniref:Phosphoribosyltransferase domain-containing protein n=1 Tax=Kribbella yunnanensis TaxID=190194 RepID=A0ABN2IP10_9ACTN